MDDQRHSIEKQKLLFDFSTEEKASAWNKSTSTFYYSEILPAINQLFNQYIPPDQFYSVECLDIDLGKIQGQEFKDALLKKLRMKLHGLLMDEPIEEADPMLEKKDNRLIPAKSVSVKVDAQRILEILYTFLNHGILKWNSNISRLEKLEQVLLEQVGIERLVQSDEFKKQMNQAFIRKRLVYQFSKPFVKGLFQQFYAKEFEKIVLFQSWMVKRIATVSMSASTKIALRKIISGDPSIWIVTSDSQQSENLANDVIHAMLAKTETQLNVAHSVTIALSILNELVNMRSQDDNAAAELNEVLKIVAAYGEYNRKPDGSRQGNFNKHQGSLKNKQTTVEEPDASGKDEHEKELTLNSSTDHSDEGPTDKEDLTVQPNPESEKGAITLAVPDGSLLAGKIEQDATSLFNGEKSEKALPVNSQQERSRRLNETQKYNPERAEEKVEALTEYYILNAGIVLCWPYLNLLFGRNKYLLSGEFKSIESRERAVHLLGYVATGHGKCEEHELVLSKLLAGWPLQSPLGKEIKLFKKEKKEADTMLESMIRNWPILKNTSVNGLRSSFFQRDGKLIREDGGWRLIVEQRSYDMLLDHMPYSIAIVKFPWSKEILKVDWA